MGLSTFSLIDTIITWIERLQATPWGGKLVALLVTLLLSVAQRLYGLPVVVVIPLAIITFAAIVYLTFALPRYLARWRPFPFAVSVPMLFEADDNIQIQILILNRQPSRRLALNIEACFKAENGSLNWYHSGDAVGVQSDVGPDEFTEGVVRFGFASVPVDQRRGGWYVRLTDMVTSRRTKTFRIPGCYPPNEPALVSHRSPTFTQKPKQIVRVTTDWGPRLDARDG